MENTQLNEDEIRALGAKLGSGIKTEQELGELTKSLRKAIIEAALGGEMTEHLGYDKHAVEGNGTGNNRNGKSKKTLKGDHGEVEIDIPRDRDLRGRLSSLFVRRPFGTWCSPRAIDTQ